MVPVLSHDLWSIKAKSESVAPTFATAKMSSSSPSGIAILGAGIFAKEG